MSHPLSLYLRKVDRAEMLNAMRRYVRQHVSISDSEFAFIEPLLRCQNMAPKSFLLKAGEVANLGAFVCRGCLRLYRIDEKGNEHIVQFAPEQWWIADRHSLSTGQPSEFFIDAIEPSWVITIEKQDQRALLEHAPQLRLMWEKLNQNNSLALEKRVLNDRMLSAEARYAVFVRNYPSLNGRLPRRMIASYLGMKPETLSRIRLKN